MIDTGDRVLLQISGVRVAPGKVVSYRQNHRGDLVVTVDGAPPVVVPGAATEQMDDLLRSAAARRLELRSGAEESRQ